MTKSAPKEGFCQISYSLIITLEIYTVNLRLILSFPIAQHATNEIETIYDIALYNIVREHIQLEVFI